MSNKMIFSSSPAKSFNDSYLLGNGRSGASVLGRVEREAITLNEDSVWYGKDYDRKNPHAKNPDTRHNGKNKPIGVNTVKGVGISNYVDAFKGVEEKKRKHWIIERYGKNRSNSGIAFPIIVKALFGYSLFNRHMTEGEGLAVSVSFSNLAPVVLFKPFNKRSSAKMSRIREDEDR